MEQTTKAIINLYEGLIQLEGSEEFVKHYLDKFSPEVKFVNQINKTTSHQVPVAKNDLKDPDENGESSKKATKRKQKVKDVKAETFDIDKKNDIPSLKDFLDEKKPGTTAKDRIAVIAYYITSLKNIESFNEGHIDYAYKALNLNKRPIHLRQILINLKNDKMWFDEGDTNGSWKVTRICEKFVEEDLPMKDQKSEK